MTDRKQQLGDSEAKRDFDQFLGRWRTRLHPAALRRLIDARDRVEDVVEIDPVRIPWEEFG